MKLLNSISLKIFLWLVLISLLPILLISQIFLSEFKIEFQKTELGYLTRISDKKIEQITNYTDKLMGDIMLFTKNSITEDLISDLENKFSTLSENPEAYNLSIQTIQQQAINFMALGYYDVFIINPKGDIIFTVKRESDFGTNLFHGPYSDTPLAEIVHDNLATFETGISAFEYYKPSGTIAAFLSMPIIKSGKLLGIVALQIDIEKTLNVVADTFGIGVTGEVIVAQEINNEVSFIWPEKFVNNPDVFFEHPHNSPLALPIQHALNGETGYSITKDYRGEDVIAAWRYLPAFRWGIVVKKDVKEAFTSIEYMKDLSFFVLILIFLSVIFIAYIVGQTIVKPIRYLTLASRKIAKGDFQQRVKVESNDEVGDLARTFNQMATELSETHKDLIKKAHEAKRANEAKSEFLSHMSHELRTPLNAILGFAQILTLDEDDFSEIQQANIKEILDAGYHLLSLINDVLDLAKIETGKLTVSVEQVFLDDIMVQSIPMIKEAAKTKNIKIIDNLSHKGYTVYADYTRLKQVMLNLLSNAVKYNRDQGMISIDAEIIDNERLRISIEDTGKGLTQQEIAKLFQPFERIDIKNNVEGTGIGLVITKHLTELMNGKIGVKSTPNQGSIFWIELNLSTEKKE
ncbi:MAG: sensor histidine kinase [Emcibacter sp.]|nr:sensor histidine kinase [Emcibacter sp.]